MKKRTETVHRDETAIPYEVNDTRDYHRRSLETLGWELTVCNALEPPSSPCRRILRDPDSYGNRLYDYLSRCIPMPSVRAVIEIGGGYGVLMRDFLNKNRKMQATMLDISPLLLQRQRHALEPSDAVFLENDILDTPSRALQPFDLAILNENLGDLPTLVDVPAADLMAAPSGSDPLLRKAGRLLKRYGIDLPQGGRVTINIGALNVVEKLCRARIPYIFAGEHSCEAVAPERWRHLLKLRPAGAPQRIRLRGHDEFTIRFSDLEKVARAFGYGIVRGPFADYLPIDFTDELQYIMAAKSPRTDEQEILRHFIEDLYQYEYLILSKGRAAPEPL